MRNVMRKWYHFVIMFSNETLNLVHKTHHKLKPTFRLNEDQALFFIPKIRPVVNTVYNNKFLCKLPLRIIEKVPVNWW